MVFSSLTFLLFFLPLVVGFTFLARRTGTKNLVLLTASLVFYAWGEPLWVYALIVESLLVWGGSALVTRAREPWHRRLWLTLGVLAPVGLLFYVKYAYFLLSPLGIPVEERALPLGVSFFTFQIVTYVVDVYRDPSLYQKNPLKVLLYVMCFPQLVAGPIVRYQDVALAIDSRTVSMNDFAAGMKRFAVGLGKKVILANTCGKIVADVVVNQAAYGMSVAGGWYMAALYALQIYFDFSGYSDMAIGIGRVLGFHYLENFDYPYISKSISEFWRRWHISLGAFFREYVYIPLGGNRKGVARQVVNLMIVWALTGLWHGASVNFVLWGMYYFVLIILERFVFKRLLDKLPTLLRWGLTSVLVLVGWVIFYFTDSGEMLTYLQALFGLGGVALVTDGLMLVVNQYSWFPLLALLAALPLKRLLTPELLEHLRPLEAVWLTLVMVLSLVMLVGQSYNPFIYFRF